MGQRHRTRLGDIVLHSTVAPLGVDVGVAICYTVRMTPEHSRIPDWALSERQRDVEWIGENLQIFWPVVQEAFAKQGRGVLVVGTTSRPTGQGQLFVPHGTACVYSTQLCVRFKSPARSELLVRHQHFTALTFSGVVWIGGQDTIEVLAPFIVGVGHFGHPDQRDEVGWIDFKNLPEHRTAFLVASDLDGGDGLGKCWGQHLLPALVVLWPTSAALVRSAGRRSPASRATRPEYYPRANRLA